MLDTVHHQGLRLALGAFRTSPVESLYVEAEEPSLYLRREKLALQYAIRLAANPSNPTFKVTFAPHISQDLIDLYDNKPNAIRSFGFRKLRKAFSKFYRRHYELISKFNVGLKSLLHQGLSEPEFYGDLVYKFKKIRGMTDFSDQFRKNIIRYKRIGYNLNVM